MGIGRAQGDMESHAVLRERVAGMEREIPQLRHDIERLRNDIYNQRTHFDEKMESQQHHIDRKVSEITQVIRITPTTAVIDHKFWWLILAIGLTVAATLIAVVIGVIRIYGNLPL